MEDEVVGRDEVFGLLTRFGKGDLGVLFGFGEDLVAVSQDPAGVFDFGWNRGTHTVDQLQHQRAIDNPAASKTRLASLQDGVFQLVNLL
ncbi:MAG: hypothetical protein O6913_03320 [Chloroflexi bacterium]|nr:hypothetical protein [Chloroflexota bacterium]MCZ6707625.1 hypothetical protein [Chloroflexota bacterium]